MPRLIPLTQQEYNALHYKMAIADIVLYDSCEGAVEPRVSLGGDILRAPELPGDLKEGDFAVVQKGVYEIVARFVVPYSEAGRYKTTGYVTYYAGVFVAGEFG